MYYLSLNALQTASGRTFFIVSMTREVQLPLKISQAARSGARISSGVVSSAETNNGRD